MQQSMDIFYVHTYSTAYSSSVTQSVRDGGCFSGASLKPLTARKSRNIVCCTFGRNIYLVEYYNTKYIYCPRVPLDDTGK